MNEPHTTPPLAPSAWQSISLAKIATILAVITGVTLGLCSATMALDPPDTVSTYVYTASLVTVWLCILGLITIAVIAIIGAIKSRSSAN